MEGNYKIAQFYEQNKALNAPQRQAGALVYYNQVLQLDPNSPYAARARQHIEQIKTHPARPPAS